MKLVHYSKVDLEPVYTEGAEGAQIRWLIGQKDGAPNFAMRVCALPMAALTVRLMLSVADNVRMALNAA